MTTSLALLFTHAYSPFLLCPDSEGGWWKAISLSTGRESYIPGICVARVYHGWLFEGLGRDKAEELLQLPDTKIGSFMIRESETKKGEPLFVFNIRLQSPWCSQLPCYGFVSLLPSTHKYTWVCGHLPAVTPTLRQEDKDRAGHSSIN